MVSGIQYTTYIYRYTAFWTLFTVFRILYDIHPAAWAVYCVHTVVRLHWVPLETPQPRHKPQPCLSLAPLRSLLSVTITLTVRPGTRIRIDGSISPVTSQLDRIVPRVALKQRNHSFGTDSHRCRRRQSWQGRVWRQPLRRRNRH